MLVEIILSVLLGVLAFFIIYSAGLIKRLERTVARMASQLDAVPRYQIEVVKSIGEFEGNLTIATDSIIQTVSDELTEALCDHAASVAEALDVKVREIKAAILQLGVELDENYVPDGTGDQFLDPRTGMLSNSAFKRNTKQASKE